MICVIAKGIEFSFMILQLLTIKIQINGKKTIVMSTICRLCLLSEFHFNSLAVEWSRNKQEKRWLEPKIGHYQRRNGRIAIRRGGR